MLLTDGDPNIFPPSGFHKTLENYKKKYPNFRPTLHTFAFGKSIDSHLLADFSHSLNGQYNFIPCAGFVGTIFVHSLSNVLSVMASNCELEIHTLNGAKIEVIPGGLPKTGQNVV